MGPDQIFSHHVPRTRRSAFRGPRFTRPGAWFRSIRSSHFSSSRRSARQWSACVKRSCPARGEALKCRLAHLLACLGISVPP